MQHPPPCLSSHSKDLHVQSQPSCCPPSCSGQGRTYPRCDGSLLESSHSRDDRPLRCPRDICPSYYALSGITVAIPYIFKRSPGLHDCRSGLQIMRLINVHYETSMALVTFSFGSVFGMVMVRMPSSTLAEILSRTTSSGST